LLTDNQEWLQLDWDRPCELRKVIVYFRRHESMWKRTIHLQQETTPGNWSDIATCLPRDAYNFAVAAFEFERPVKLKAIRVFNLFDMAEIIVQ
jgi:hypothetical protein